MNIINAMFSAIYFFAERKRWDKNVPYTQHRSISYISLSEGFLCNTIWLNVVKNFSFYNNLNIQKQFSMYLFIFIIAIINYAYYNDNKVQIITNEFKKKSKKEQEIWTIFSVPSPMIFLIIMIITS